MNELTVPTDAALIRGDTHDKHIIHFSRWLDGRAVNEDTVRGYFEALNESGLAPSTMFSVKKNSRLSPCKLPGKNRGKFPGFTVRKTYTVL